MDEKDLLSMAMQIVVAEEVGRQIGEKVEVEVEVPRPRTVVIDVRNLLVEDRYELLDVAGPGHLKELLVVSPSSSFSLSLLVDGRAIKLDFADLVEVSEVLERVDAFERDGRYVLRLSDVKWVESFLAVVQVDQPTQLERVFADYDVFVVP
ncbi:MAG: hypothetical protein QXU69_04690 [Thermofilaceae archaeon]